MIIGLGFLRVFRGAFFGVFIKVVLARGFRRALCAASITLGFAPWFWGILLAALCGFQGFWGAMLAVLRFLGAVLAGSRDRKLPWASRDVSARKLPHH